MYIYNVYIYRERGRGIEVVETCAPSMWVGGCPPAAPPGFCWPRTPGVFVAMENR